MGNQKSSAPVFLCSSSGLLHLTSPSDADRPRLFLLQGTTSARCDARFQFERASKRVLLATFQIAFSSSSIGAAVFSRDHLHGCLHERAGQPSFRFRIRFRMRIQPPQSKSAFTKIFQPSTNSWRPRASLDFTALVISRVAQFPRRRTLQYPQHYRFAISPTSFRKPT